jgi:preprotein translocase subunit SecF
VLEISNRSINQTLSRTIITSGTTLLVLLALYFLGGEAIAGFSLALIIGVVVGTYSTIYIATAMAVWLGISRQDLLPAAGEGGRGGGRPALSRCCWRRTATSCARARRARRAATGRIARRSSPGWT